MGTYDKLVLVTRKTRLQQLVERFNSKGQARFYIEHAGGDFADYAAEDEAYARALDALHRQLDLGLRVQTIERAIVPTFLFAPTDLVVTVGQDGLVANVAKYAGAQPIVAVNPDPARFDGVLLPFRADGARAAVARVLDGKARMREVTLAEARLADGQRLLAFNDLFIGARSHVSARYALRAGTDTAEDLASLGCRPPASPAPSATRPGPLRGQLEVQSSSGIIVSTGAGSTGWLSSVFNMAAAVAAFTGGSAGTPPALAWEDPRLCFVVREPFASKHSGIRLTAGVIAPGDSLTIESHMPQGGVIFSDGVEADAITFDAGAVATVAAAARRTRLVVA